MRTHPLEGRKREERVGELRNMAGHKRGLINWRGGRGRSGLVSFETWHVINEDSLTGGEKEGGVGWRAQKCGTLQMRTHQQEGRMREESICELGNMAHQRAHSLEGRKGRNALVSSETWHVANKDSLARGEEEGGGRSGLVSLEMWHATNEDALPGEEEEGRVGWWAWKHGTLILQTRTHQPEGGRG